jgi:magnesium chelatase subunit D
MIAHEFLKSLLLLAVEPKLKGLLIAAGPGFGKSTLIRAYRALLPDPFIELPLNITEDRLLGGLDFERTIATGKRCTSIGLLAAAHGGTLYVDEINLLDSAATNQISGALGNGYIHLEREGLSASHPTNFLLVGTYDPAENELRSSLLDRVGLFIAPTAINSPDRRIELIEQVLASDQVSRVDEKALEIGMLNGLIAEARTCLSNIQISYEVRRSLSLAGLQLGVEGNRADIFALRAARAHAALSGRNAVDEEDIEAAIRSVLIPRATVLPTEEKPKHDDSRRSRQNDSSERQKESPRDLESTLTRVEDLIIKAIDTGLPEGLFDIQNHRPRRTKIGSRGESLNRKRGRHIRSISGKPSEGKIALPATLRAAVTRQIECCKKITDRRVIVKLEDLRLKRFKQKAGMLFIFVVDASGSMALNRMGQAKGALTRLLEQAYIHRDRVALISFRDTKAYLVLPPSQSVERAKRALDGLPVGGGTPVAAGLLAALDLAKRARHSGIEQIMLLLFTDGRANVGLDTDEIPDRVERRRKIKQELAQLGAALQYESITSVVIDTQSSFTSNNDGRALAEMMGGRYIYLPRADVKAVSNAVIRFTETTRKEIGDI